jgi:hypothetical protein
MNERVVPERTKPYPTGAADPVSTQAEVRALAQKMYDFRFSACAGTPRSQEYKAGFMAGLLSRLAGETINYPYKTGTAAADAYFSGIDEGLLIGKVTAEESPLPARFSAGHLVQMVYTRQRGRVKSSFFYMYKRVYVVDIVDDIGIPATSYAEEASLIALGYPAP